MNPRAKMREIAEQWVPEEFNPVAYYDPDGDCIECIFADEPFYANRLDKWVTVYYGRDCNDVVGSLIKNLSEMLKTFPGMKIDIHGDKTLLSHLLRGPAYQEGDDIKSKTYKALIDKAESSNLEVALTASS